MLNQMNQQIDTQRRERETYEREQYQRALYKARMELFRTFKIDDAMLFHEAMNKIFMQVVDDVIEQGGGKIVKEIKGGENKLFDIQTNVPQNQPVQQPVQPQTDGRGEKRSLIIYALCLAILSNKKIAKKICSFLNPRL